MKGATDGGAHIEGMRTGRMKAGFCQLRADGCQGYSRPLERHHEKYRPERCIYVCHHCHHLLHFRPYFLTAQQKEKLLMVRHTPGQWLKISEKPRVKEQLLRCYIAPGRRPAQLAIRRELKADLKEQNRPSPRQKKQLHDIIRRNN